MLVAAVVGVLALDLALPFASLSDFASLEAARLLLLPSPAIAALLLQTIRAWTWRRFPIGCLCYARTVQFVEHRAKIRGYSQQARADHRGAFFSVVLVVSLGAKALVVSRAHTMRQLQRGGVNGSRKVQV